MLPGSVVCTRYVELRYRPSATGNQLSQIQLGES